MREILYKLLTDWNTYKNSFLTVAKSLRGWWWKWGMGLPVLEGNQLEIVNSTFLWYSNSPKSLQKRKRFFFFLKKKKEEENSWQKKKESIKILLVHKMSTFMLRVSQRVWDTIPMAKHGIINKHHVRAGSHESRSLPFAPVKPNRQQIFQSRDIWPK